MPTTQRPNSSLSVGSLTDTGLVRKMNQDSFAILTAEEMDGHLDGLFVVADGMGGKAGGEIASRVTVDTVPAVVQELLSSQAVPTNREALADALRHALEAANDAVYTQARANPELRGMGTTCVAALISGSQAIIGNVGDSRVYLLRDRRLMQVTSDHSLVQEHVRSGELTAEQARGSRFKNVITRAIGIASGVDPDIDLLSLQPGDTLLLCSDGLTNMVSEGEIAHALGTFEDVTECCQRLVDHAKKNGGIDNITTVVVRYGPFSRVAGPDIIETADEQPEMQRPTPSGRKRRSSQSPALWVMLIVVTCALIMVSGEVYVFAPRWPFLSRRSAEPSEFPATPPVVDFSKLKYDDPALITATPVRGGLLVCDPDGNVTVLSAQSRAIMTFGPDGSETTFASADPAPTSVRSDRFWAKDAQGNLYVSSPAAKAVTKYDRLGTRIGVIGKGKLISPQAIGLDAKGNIYVVDGTSLVVIRAMGSTEGEAGSEQGDGGTAATSHQPTTGASERGTGNPDLGAGRGTR